VFATCEFDTESRLEDEKEGVLDNIRRLSGEELASMRLKFSLV